MDDFILLNFLETSTVSFEFYKKKKEESSMERIA